MLTEHTPSFLLTWDELHTFGKLETYTSNHILYTPITPATDLFLLHTGSVSLYLMENDRRQVRLQQIQPGQLFGHVALLNSGPYDCYAETSGPVRLARINAPRLSEYLLDNGRLALALLEDLGRYRLEVSQRFDEVAFMSVSARLASVLLNLAEQVGDLTSLPRHSHRQLAEMVNAYRETVTKVINQFAAARLLEIDRYTITLLNPTRLQELAQGW